MAFADMKTKVPGPKSAELIGKWKQYEVDKLGFQVPVAIESGDGAILKDVDGNTYIDWTSGVIVTNVGHAHPVLVEAMHEASKHILNIYEWCSQYRVKAAEDLVEAAPEQYDRCFFLSTGSEVTDCAARIMKRNTGRFEIVSFFGAFHGRTLSTSSMGGLKKQKLGMGPMLPGSIRIPYPYCYRCPLHCTPGKCGFACISLYDDIVRANSCGSLAGFIGELYQGAGGYVFPPEGFWKHMEEWIRSYGMLFTLDEVQSSYGRTGSMWAQEQEGIRPDITTVGKGIGGGAVVTALLLKDSLVKDSMGPGDMGSTYGGNPVACAAVSAVLKIFRDEDIVRHVHDDLWPMFAERLPKLKELSPYVGDVRGRGCAWGIELVKDRQTKEPAPELARALVLDLANHGLLTGIVGMYSNVIRVSPPLVMTVEQTDEALSILERCVSAMRI